MPFWGRIGDRVDLALPLCRWIRASPDLRWRRRLPMASLEFRSNAYRIVFRFRGKKFQCPLKTEDRKEAEGCQARLNENLRLLERGRLVLSPEAGLPTFLLSDGRVCAKPGLPDAPLTLEELAKQYAELQIGRASC